MVNFLLIISISCNKNPLNIDVSEVKVNLEINRFEHDLFSQKTLNIDNLKQKYGVFYQDFTERVIRIGASNNPSTNYQLTKFITNTDVLKVKKDVAKQYADFSEYKNDLTLAFKHYKYYFPSKSIPKIITYVSGFNYAIITDKNYLGLGLDMFLGKNYDAYGKLGIPKYKASNMDSKHLVASAMLAWISTEFEMQDNNANLLSEMIQQGKLLYLLDALMPEEDNFIKINYTPTQYKWCKKNAKQVWFYFIDNKLLYTKKNADIIKYMGESPFISGFPDGSPGRIGHWQGWQIVKAYMKNNPKITIKKLMNEKNAQRILNLSKYKPS